MTPPRRRQAGHEAAAHVAQQAKATRRTQRPSDEATKHVRRFAALALLLAAGCMPKAVAIPLAVPEFASADNDVNHGHEVYIAKCNKCHGYPAPDAASEQKWPGVMDVMGQKSQLSDADTQAVLRYIMALREAGIR